ncbi:MULTISPECIES: hypothetical protein [unclassified Micromonospora]|uniref:hypothetical protein n=1 Tax=unclassified Micromonospora TaxID=2617518 RepID=UPI003A8B037F
MRVPKMVPRPEAELIPLISRMEPARGAAGSVTGTDLVAMNTAVATRNSMVAPASRSRGNAGAGRASSRTATAVNAPETGTATSCSAGTCSASTPRPIRAAAYGTVTSTRSPWRQARRQARRSRVVPCQGSVMTTATTSAISPTPAQNSRE